MKPVTVVLGLAAIIGTGTLTKIAEAIELVAAIQTGLAANPKLVEWIEQELNQKQSQLATIENWKGINIKGGINTITGNTLNF
jgi:phosphoribosylaminoimidazole (AIR) synthetase